MVSERFEPFTVLADSKATLEMVAALRAGTEKALFGRDDFQQSRKRTAGGVLRLHLDLAKLAPPIARIGLNKRDDVGAMLFASHVLHAAKTARTLSASVALNGGAAIELFADVDPVPPLRAFTETRPSRPVLAPPAGCFARDSLPRDLKQFWNDRESLLSEAARAPFAEFQNNLGILMGGLTVEDLFAGLGSAFDWYATRGGPGAAGHVYPAAALVAVLADPALESELLLSFQTTLGIVNAQRTQESLPRFFQESTKHRDVLIACARYLPGSFPDPADDRFQLEPSFATVRDRVIFGTNRAIVRALVDQVLDGKTQPRVPGDEVEIRGPDASAALLDAAAIVRAQMTLRQGRSEESAKEVVDMLALVLSKVRRATARIDVEDRFATLSLRVEAPDLVRAPESR
jgi:hypothetical protein